MFQQFLDEEVDGFLHWAEIRTQELKLIYEDEFARALQEDVGDGDITGALISLEKMATAHITALQPAVICGIPWAEEVFNQLGGDVSTNWLINEGQEVMTGDVVAVLSGSARSLLTGERTALNFLQTLSGTATCARRYSSKIQGSSVRLLDTRKTIPGLRKAQKYAVRIGGCSNHRMGLYDSFLIKENQVWHILMLITLSLKLGFSMSPTTRKRKFWSVRNNK